MGRNQESEHNMPFQVHTTDTFGPTYRDPDQPHLSVRFKSKTGNKTLGDLVTENVVSEIIVNDSLTVSDGGVSGSDALSLRVRVSGSSLSNARVTELLGMLAGQLMTWDSEHVFQGYNPVTTPTILTG